MMRQLIHVRVHHNARAARALHGDHRAQAVVTDLVGQRLHALHHGSCVPALQSRKGRERPPALAEVAEFHRLREPDGIGLRLSLKQQKNEPGFHSEK